MEEKEQRRKYYRIRYPYPDRPKLIIGKDEYQIIDISEEGVKFFSPADKFKLNLPVCGLIKFHDGEIIEIEGKILRLQPSRVIILLSKRIPFRKILNEQRYLLKKYVDYR